MRPRPGQLGDAVAAVDPMLMKRSRVHAVAAAFSNVTRWMLVTEAPPQS